MIKNQFDGFLDYDQMEQNKTIRSHYRNAYGIEFYHDFNKYEPLRYQLPDVKKKYSRRIKRFYRSIKKPTLFIRYVQDEAELDYIASNLLYIKKVLKISASDNRIIFILDKEYTNDFLKDETSFLVTKDEGDTVAREFLDKNTDLVDYLKQSVPESKKNMGFYYKIITKKFGTYLSRKQKNRVKSIQQEYIHSRIY